MSVDWDNLSDDRRRAELDAYVADQAVVLEEWKRHIADLGGPAGAELDSSPESLYRVADWYAAWFDDGHTTNEDAVLRQGWTAYLAAVLLQAVPRARWAVIEAASGPTRVTPGLSGFAVPCDVRHIAGTALHRVWEQRSSERTQRLFHAWVDPVRVPDMPDEAGPQVTSAASTWPWFVESLDDDPDGWDAMVSVDAVVDPSEDDLDALVDDLLAAPEVAAALRDDRLEIVVRLRAGRLGEVQNVVARWAARRGIGDNTGQL